VNVGVEKGWRKKRERGEKEKRKKGVGE